MNRLISKTQVTKNILSNNWVKNFSSRHFTQSQINVFKKGTKFAIAPTNIPSLDFVCGVEQGLMQVDHKHKASINYTRAQVVNIPKTAKPPKQNLSKEEIVAIKEVKSYNDIIILNADIGNCSVVLDKMKYHKKVLILQQDPKTYRTVKKNPTLRIEKRLNSFVWNLFECKKLSFSMYKFLRSTDSVLPRILWSSENPQA